MCWTNVSFTVVGAGVGLTYQWKKDGTNIGSATAATYSITGITAANGGSYTCLITGTCGNITSNGAVLTVNPATLITVQPVNVVSCTVGQHRTSDTASRSALRNTSTTAGILSENG